MSVSAMRAGVMLAAVHALATGCDADNASASTGTGGAGGPIGTGGVRACGANDVFTPLRFRIQVPLGVVEPQSLPYPQPGVSFEVAGTVANVSRVEQPCPDDCDESATVFGTRCPTCVGGFMPSVRIDIDDQQSGARWAIVVSPEDALPGWEAAGRAMLGQPVTLSVRYHRGFQAYVAVGFTIHDAEGLVMASDGGRYANALFSGDTPSLVLEKVMPICQELVTCEATRVFQMLSFQGTTTAVVGAGPDGELTIGTRRYTARNQGVRTLVQPIGHGCADWEEASPWSIWLKPSP
jgi:hypothetical protein